jgi:hypothetical protein
MMASMTRIVGGGVATKNPFGPEWAKGAGEAQSLGQQVQHELFGRKKPRELDPDDADVAAQMARLHAYKKKLAYLAGDSPDDYQLALASGTIAMIDQDGKIYVGKRFLLEQAENVHVLVGVVAHEVGHRPKRWQQYRQEQPRTRAELEGLCRLEETYADYFAGHALAELGLDVEPLCAFLAQVQDQPHPEYFSAALRADVLREGHGDAKRKATNRKKFFPELDKRQSGKLDLGTG